MSRKLLEIAYLGTAYCGWQVQPNGITVQEILQASLHKVLKHKPAVTGCSRTDSGVHAKSFFCHFDTELKIPNSGLVLGLNTVLPDDIAALNCYDVADDFHARYSATGKMYRYSFLYSKIKNPFLFGRTLQIKSPIDIKLANEYCNLLKGTHDFEAFSSVNRTVKDTVRTVSECYVEFKNDRFDFYVKADGFLYNMVRIMVGTLLEYSSGKISSNDIKNAFITGDRTLLGATAPPQGLYLEKVFYDNDNFMILDDRS
ncbi:MAG: tRNA pseudouridine(38-40) synthase TruA [Clostridia bacterium]|nr:tRNA pseudouridine(38-40) synthase TruA [Clostridia bacterium]